MLGTSGSPCFQLRQWKFGSLSCSWELRRYFNVFKTSELQDAAAFDVTVTCVVMRGGGRKKKSGVPGFCKFKANLSIDIYWIFTQNRITIPNTHLLLY